MNFVRKLKLALGAVLVLSGVAIGVVWTQCRVYVGPTQCLVLIRKTGAPMPAGQLIAEDGQKGIQRDVLGPGRYFFNPIVWDWELQPLVEISAGDPATWKEVYEAGAADFELPKLAGQWPEVGVVTSLAGKPWDKPDQVVEEGYQGVRRNVLTPGTYRLNPRAYKIEKTPAVVVPLGCVGVVTSQIGEMPGTEIKDEVTLTSDGKEIHKRPTVVQKLAEAGQRGVLKNVLPPGIYYMNPKVQQVKIVQIGYNQISQLRTKDERQNISFPSEDGFMIDVEVTVVWGRHPRHMPEMTMRLGEVDKIKELIRGQLRSICRNIGSQYKSTDFIQGERREQYQKAMTEALHRACAERDIEILIALVQNIEVHGRQAGAAGGAPIDQLDLKKTIQRGFIAAEEDLTNQKRQETAKVKAELETAKASVNIAREKISSETRKKVAEIEANAGKRAAEIDAERDLKVAQVDRQAAEIDAEKRLVLGKAQAQVERLRNTAEADGKRMMIEAFGSGRAYNLYTFAKEFSPESIRLIFAGEGTMWTDLSKMQDAAAMRVLAEPAAESLKDTKTKDAKSK